MRAPPKNAKYPKLHGLWKKTARQMGDKPTGKGQALDRKEKNHHEHWEVVHQRKKWEKAHPTQVKGRKGMLLWI